MMAPYDQHDDFIAEIMNNGGPRDIYEKTAISFNTADALEFLCRQCQSKDLIIAHLTRTIHNELGEGFWDKYADDLKITTSRDLPDNVIPLVLDQPDIPF